MRWIYLLGVFCAMPWQSLLCKETTPLGSFEDRLERLERDSGIDLRKEKTTVFFFGDFIYWKTSLDGVAYATTAEVELDPLGDLVFNQVKAKTVAFDYAPAFQIGLGVGLPHDHWDISARWLRSFSKGTDTAHGDLTVASGNKVIFDSVGLIEGLVSPPSRVQAGCRVRLDLGEIALGRTFLWSRYFWFKLYGGLRGAWVRMDWDISYQIPIVIPSAAAQTYTDFFVENDYTGGGFVGGFESKWNIYKEFGMFSKASASLMYGRSVEKTRQKFFSIPAEQEDTFEQTLTAHRAMAAVKATFDIAVGLKWEANFSKTGHILLWAGYDFFYWPSVAQKTIVQLSGVRDRTDLSFEGLVVGARVDF